MISLSFYHFQNTCMDFSIKISFFFTLFSGNVILWLNATKSQNGRDDSEKSQWQKWNFNIFQKEWERSMCFVWTGAFFQFQKLTERSTVCECSSSGSSGSQCLGHLGWMIRILIRAVWRSVLSELRCWVLSFGMCCILTKWMWMAAKSKSYLCATKQKLFTRAIYKV